MNVESFRHFVLRTIVLALFVACLSSATFENVNMLQRRAGSESNLVIVCSSKAASIGNTAVSIRIVSSDKMVSGKERASDSETGLTTETASIANQARVISENPTNEKVKAAKSTASSAITNAVTFSCFLGMEMLAAVAFMSLLGLGCRKFINKA